MSASKINPSLQKKTAARTASVQIVYRQSMNGDKITAAQQVAALKEQLSGNKDEQRLLVGAPIEPNYALAESIISGVCEWRGDIDKRIDGTLDKNWKRERMSPLLIAILQCAIFELFFHKENKAKIIIDEYTRITRSFFADGEVKFVHGALNALDKKYNG